MLTLDKIYHASYVLKDVIRQTNIVQARGICDDCDVYLKPENLQITGSFKVRGSGYKISQLTEEEKAREDAKKAAQAAEERMKAKEKAKEGKNAEITDKSTSSESTASQQATVSSSGSGLGQSVANYAVKFVGNPYVYGGTSLTNGADCSGFVMSVYKNFGVSLPHSSTSDRYVGYNVASLANAQPGDLVCYSGHVAIYIGNGQIVHASTEATGIKISNASYRTPVAIRRIF